MHSHNAVRLHNNPHPDREILKGEGKKNRREGRNVMVTIARKRACPGTPSWSRI